MKNLWKLVGSTALVAGSQAALADITIGVSLPLTGPASSLGIPMANGFKLWPPTIAGQKVNLMILDDATDPSKGVQNARKFVTEYKVDLIAGSGATPVATAMVDVSSESMTPQLSLAPMPLPPGKDAWTFRIPPSNGIMAAAVVTHMRKASVKTVGLLGYSDAFGESWLQELNARLPQAGIKLVAVERFARSDASVTGQALKLTAAAPDAVVVVASGSGAAMPQLGLVERGYKGRIYQTHAAATRDLIRVGGQGVEGALVSAGPVVVVEQLPDSNASKIVAAAFVKEYEAQFGIRSRTPLAGHSYDIHLLLEHVLPDALKKAKPGTAEFRQALRESLESMKPVALTNGMLQFSSSDHWGFKPDAAIVARIVGGEWRLEP